VHLATTRLFGWENDLVTKSFEDFDNGSRRVGEKSVIDAGNE